LNEAKTEKKTNSATGRLAQHYKCCSCGGEFSAKNVQVDHISPVVDPDKGFIDWDTFIENLFCEPENLQVLCLVCHKAKSAEEKAVRTEKNKK